MAIVLHGRDLLIVAVLAAFVAWLLYRIFRREPNTRVIRFGVFIERRRHGEDGQEITERIEWPGQRPE